MVKPAAHDSLVGCSNHSSLILVDYHNIRELIKWFMLHIRVLELVDRTILSFVDLDHERSSRSSDIRFMISTLGDIV